MIKIFPFIFVLLWSSAFITTKPIIDNSDPFSALAFRFLFVAIGFYLFSIYSKQRVIVDKKKIFQSFLFYYGHQPLSRLNQLSTIVIHFLLLLLDFYL